MHVKTVRLLFNDDMARAIVEGRKIVTRRPVMPMGPQSMQALIDSRGGRGWPCAPGDLLIGRECWRAFGGIRDVRVDYRAGCAPTIIGRDVDHIAGAVAHYLPDVSRLESPGRWRPSIHMPDWAARIRRRVVSVTAERLQDITSDDAFHEGFRGQWGSGPLVIPSNASPTPREEFHTAWNSIYAAKGLGWDSNCWVWRIEFGAENEA